MSSYDIIDENDNLINQIATYNEVHEKGLWYRAVHAIIYTPEKEIVMQKRAPSLAYHPDEIEISVGGGVDAGETPEGAIIREIKEELGISIKKSQLRYIGKTKFNHKTLTQINRFFLYSYAVCVDKKSLKMSVNPQETSAIFLITARKLRRALKVHRIKNMGRISDINSYWNYLLDSVV
jgi:8-oxo-dGTP pyrophosphatase MutT (NUDIX family)